MAEICVIYLLEDEGVVARMVFLLRKHWDVWYARDIAHGDWEEAVRAKILESSAVVPVLSQHAKGERKTIVKDEMRYAKKEGKPIFPFLIGTADIPFGFGDLSHTEAHGWTGDEADEGYQQLKAKIAKTIGRGRNVPNAIDRAQELKVRKKAFRLPTIVFSPGSSCPRD
jgi:hypothetical protein